MLADIILLIIAAILGIFIGMGLRDFHLYSGDLVIIDDPDEINPHMFLEIYQGKIDKVLNSKDVILRIKHSRK